MKTLKIQFCDFAVALTNALASGMNMYDALDAVHSDLQTQYSEDALIVCETQEIINGMRNNIPIETMLSDFGTRSSVEDIQNFAIVFSTCYRTGGDIRSVIRRTSEVLSEKTIISSEIETVITSNKMQMSAMNLLPIIIVLMMKSMSAQFAESLSSGLGVVALTVAAGLFVASYKIGQKIMDIKG